MAVELAVAYLSIVPETSKITPGVAKALGGAEKTADASGKAMGSRLAAGIGSTLKTTAVGAGVTAGAAIAGGLTKGVGRLTAIEGATTKLSGLGSSATQVGGIMENALAAVKGTAFGLDEAATIAASAVAAGIKPGQELEGVLKTVGDSAAISGRSMKDMGLIFGKVAATGRLQGDEVLQLAEAGIPALSLLSKHLGKTTADVQDMVTKGKIDFKTFSDAMGAGMGGAALKMGESTQGALRNMTAAAGRLGATLSGPFYQQAGGAFRGITTLLDGLDGKAKPVMADLDKWFRVTGVPALQSFGKEAVTAFDAFRNSDFARTSITDVSGVVSSLAGTAKEALPAVVGIGSALGQASAALGVSGWQIFLTTVQAGSAVLDAVVGPLQTVSDLMQAHPGVVTAAAAAWLAFKTVPSVMGPITPLVGSVTSSLRTASAGTASFGSAVRDSMRWAGQANPQLSTMGRTLTVLGTNGAAAASAGLAKLKTAGSNLLGVFGGPLGAALTGATVAVTAGVAANQKLENAQRSLSSASQDLAGSQKERWAQIGNASGVADAVVAQVKAVKDAISAEMSGEMRGIGSEFAAIGKNFSWSGIKESLSGGNLGQDMLDQANKTADGARRAKAALDSLKMSNDDVAKAISGSAGDWTMFAARLRSTGEDGQAALAKFQPLRDEFVKMQEAAALATPGTLELSKAVDVLADASSTGSDKLSALESALKSLGLIESDAEDATFQLAESVDKIVESAQQGADAAGGLGDALIGVNGKLDPTKKNARELRGELDELGQKFQAQAAATGDAQKAYAASAPALDALAQKYGLTTEQVRKLAEGAGMVPDKVGMLLAVEGADESRQKLTEVALKLGEIPEGQPKTITMRVDDVAARQALTDIGLKVVEVEGQPGMVRISANNDVALAAIGVVNGRLSTLGKDTATPKITANDTAFRITDQDTLASLARLRGETADPKIGAIIDGFLSGRAITMEEINTLNGTTAEPNITAKISEALQKAQIVNDALDQAARERTATIALVYRGASQYDSSGTAVGQQYASGGRLPLTGPGTEKTDGILGVSSKGVPMSWVDAGEWIVNRRSSDKYDRELAAINAGTFPKLPGYADGGKLGAKELTDLAYGRIGGASRPLEGAPYVWGGTNWGDCSGAMSPFARGAAGLDPFGGRFATGNMREALTTLGFRNGSGSAGDLRFGWFNGGPYGGHTAGTLPDGTRVEMGGARGNGQINGGAAGADDPQWTDRAYLPLGPSFDWSDKPYAGRKGAGLTVGDVMSGNYSGATSFTSGGGSGAGRDRPTTWSGVAGQFAKDFTTGTVSDALGVFGVPDRLPPILQAWNALNEVPEFGGPTDWDLSVAAANVKKFDAQLRVQTAVMDEAAKTLAGVKNSPIGDASWLVVKSATDRLAEFSKDVENTRLAKDAAQAHLADMVGTRNALMVASQASTSNARASDQELTATAQGKDDAPAPKVEVVYNPSGGAGQWDPLMSSLLAEKKLPASFLGAFRKRLDQESSGNPRAVNDWDSNALAGWPTKGGMQMRDDTFKAFADPGKTDIFNMEHNMRASLNYVMRDPKYRGRTVESVYAQAGGYWNGGSISAGSGRRDDVPIAAAQGEFIVNREAASRNRAELEQINSGARSTSPQQQVTYNIHAFDLEEAMSRVQTRERQRAVSGLGVR